MSVVSDIVQRELGGVHYCRRTTRRCCQRRLLASHPKSKVNPLNHSQKILTDLLSSETRVFAPVTKEPIKTQGSGVSYANHLLIRRSRESPSENRNHEIQQFGKRSYRCFDVRNPSSRPFYSIEMRPIWEDEVIIAAATNVPSPSSTNPVNQKPVIFVLRKGSLLDCYCLKTGYLISTVSLAQFPGETYRELSFDYSSGFLVAKSTRTNCARRNTRPENRSPTDTQDDVLLSFIIFRYPPFELVTKFEVRKSVFGDRITDADLACQTLMVLETNSLTKVYDIWEVLESQRKRNVRMIQIESTHRMHMIIEISEQSEHGETQTEESHKTPRCLGTFRSYNQYLMLSPSKHCLYVDPKDLGFKLKPVWPPDEDVSGLRGNPGTVKSLPQSPEKKESRSEVGMLVGSGGQSWDPLSKDTVVFSPDDSPRLIGVFGQHFRIDEFSGTDEAVRTVFSMDTDPPPIRFPGYVEMSHNCVTFLGQRDCLTNCQDLEVQSVPEDILPGRPEPPDSVTSQGRETTTRSGRRVTSRQADASLEASSPSVSSQVSWDYEDELDLLVVLAHVTTSDSDHLGEEEDEDEVNSVELKTVTLVDNETLRVLKEVPLYVKDRRGSFDINLRVHVTLDRDVLIVNVQSSVRTSTYIYQLREASAKSEEEELLKKYKSLKVKRRQ